LPACYPSYPSCIPPCPPHSLFSCPPPPTAIYTLSLHDALPIFHRADDRKCPSFSCRNLHPDLQHRFCRSALPSAVAGIIAVIIRLCLLLREDFPVRLEIESQSV